MKKYLALLMFLGLSACDKESKEDGIPSDIDDIVGSWQIVSESYSIGGPQINIAVENGAIYDFRLDYTFIYKYAKDTSRNFSGTFDFEEDVLSLSYVRDGEDANWDLKTSFDDGLVTWFPIGPTICIEGCSTTLKRID